MSSDHENFSDDSVKDVLNRTPYNQLSKTKERKLLKALKLSFYHQQSENPEKQAQYIEYFAEEYPWFRRKMASNIPDKERKRLLEEAIAISTEVRDDFILNNIRLVAKYSKKLEHYLNNTEGKTDLFQEGIIGLIIAAEKFDFDSDTRFSTYATYWIRNNIQRYIESVGTGLHIPASSVEQIRKMKMAEEAFLMHEHKFPTNRELADILNITEDRLIELQSIYNPRGYLDLPINEEGETIGTLIPDKSDEFEQVETALLIESLDYSTLTEEEKAVIALRFGFVNDEIYSRKEISVIRNLKPSQVRTNELNAVKKMAKTLHPQTYYEISSTLSKAS